MKNSPLPAEVVKEKEWDPKVGIKIPYNHNIIFKMLTCTTEMNGNHFTSNYMFHKIGESCFGGEICREMPPFCSGSSYVSPF